MKVNPEAHEGVMASEESIAAKDTDIVLKMARKLGVDIHALEKRAARDTCRTFPEYRKIRDTYLEI